MPESPFPTKRLRWQELLFTAISGVLMALAFPGIELSLLAWVALVPLCLVVFLPRRKRDMAALFASFSLGFYLTLLYWFLWMHPLTWLGFSEFQSQAIVIVALLGSNFLLMLQWVVFGFIFGWMTQPWGKAHWKHAVALALGWTTMEWITSLGAFGFTWGNLALSQYETLPMLQIIDVVGSYPLAALIVGVNAAIALALRAQYAKPFAIKHWAPVGVALVPVVGSLAYGLVRLGDPLPETNFSVEIVQGNIYGGDKFAKGREALDKTVGKYLALSDQHADTDLVLWPETAMPLYLRNDMPTYEKLRSVADRQNRYYMFGTLDWEGQPPEMKLFNAVTAFGPEGQPMGFDYKRHLVPFGEYVPGRNLLPKPLMEAAGLINILGMDYAPGVDPHLFQFPFAKIGAGVCYDGIFPDAIRPTVLKGAEVLALVTNDAWYKDTTAPRVLLAHAVLRAVENKRYVLRAANTGISSVITPKGNTQGRTPVYQDATLVGRAAPMRELTVYTRFGDWASALAGLGVLGLMVNAWMNRRRRKSSAIA